MANNWQLDLVGSLEGNKSRNQLNSDIKGLSRNLDKLKLYAEIDKNQVTQLQHQLKKLQVEVNNVTVSDTVINGLVAKINAGLQNVTIGNINIGNVNTQAKQVDQQIGNNIAQSITSGINKAKSELKSFSDLTNFSELNKKIEHFQIDTSELKNYNGILDRIKEKYAEFGQVKITNEQFDNGILEKFRVNIEQVNGDLKETKSFMMSINDDKDTFVFDGIIKGSESVVQHLDKTKNAVNQTADAINALKDKAKADEIKLSFDNGLGDSKYNNRIQALENQFVKYGMSVDEAKQKTANLRTILDGFKVDGNFLPDDELIAQENKLKKVFWAIKISVDSAKLSFDKFLQPVSSEKASSLIIRINDFLSKNKNITKEANEELEKYVRLLQNGNVNLNDWNKFNNRLKEINVEMREAGRLGKTLKQTLIDGAKSFAQWTISSVSVMEVVQAFKKMFDAVVEVDSAMIELTKVSNASSNDLKNYFDEAAESAKDLGVTVSDVVSATADWSRLGYNLPDSKQLAEVATLYKNVGDGIDIETANQSLVSTLRGFQLDAKDAMNIIDQFNEVANNFPIDSAGIGEALQRSAASFYEANTDLSKSIALITGTNSVIQDPDSVGKEMPTFTVM